MQKILWVAVVLALSGCATTDGALPQISRSGFDDARTVTIGQHGNACTSMVCTGLGAQWTAKAPERAVLNVSIFNDFAGITAAKLNVDGTVIDLTPTAGITSFSVPGAPMKESTRGFSLPLQTVRDMVAARKVWLRVSTPTGYVEDAVIDGATDSKAFHAMKRFLGAVDLK